jgi:hypothetical protein
MNNFGKHLFVMMFGAVTTLAFSGTAHAIPITADIANFSLIHLGSNPSGTGDPDDWFNFDSGQTLDLDFDTNASLLSLLGPQSFSMSTNNGALSTLDLLSFDMDLNDTDGFAGGEVSYFLDSVAGTFIFSDANYNAIYNTSSISDGVLTLSIWGGDEINDLGLDMGLTAQVPEPGVLMLFLIGMVAMRYSMRGIA